MPKFLSKLRKLKTNDNILIAIDVLYNSKSSFMGIFLMSFMIGVSLQNSPISFLSYELTHYALNGVMCVFLADILRAHPVGAWRASMLTSVAMILAVILIDPNYSFFPLVVGILSAVESQLYYRPKDFLEVKEVNNTARERFNSTRQILVEIVRIVMPVILGLAISNTSYERSAIIILAISVVQVLLSVLFRPTHEISVKTHSLRESLKYTVSHDSIRHTLWMQALRGVVLTGCAYEIVSQLNVYSSSSTNLELGSYQSLSSLIAIVLLMIYRKLVAKNKRAENAIVLGLLPAVILLPVMSIVFPGNFVIAIALYIYAQSVVRSLYSSTIFAVYHQDTIKKYVHDDTYRIEIEILGELWLTFGRVFSLVPILIFACIGRADLMLPTVAIQSIVAPIIFYFIYKFEPSRASDTH